MVNEVKGSVVNEVVKAASSEGLFGFLCKLHQIDSHDGGEVARKFQSLLSAKRLYQQSQKQQAPKVPRMSSPRLSVNQSMLSNLKGQSLL